MSTRYVGWFLGNRPTFRHGDALSRRCHGKGETMRLTQWAQPALLGCGAIAFLIAPTPLMAEEPVPATPSLLVLPANEPISPIIGDPTSDALDLATSPKTIALVSHAAVSPSAVQVLQKGTSDRAAMNAAVANLPLAEMTTANRARARRVIDNVSMFRSMPTIRIPVDHDVYQFFVDHPDVAVSTWRALDVSQCQLWQTGPASFEADLGDGSFGVIDVLHKAPGDVVIIGDGEFKSPLLSAPIKAVGVMHLKTKFVTLQDGKTETISHATLFVNFPSQTIETAAKIISPFTNMVIDRNFQEVGLYAHMMTEAMRNQPGWIEMVVGQLDGILERNRIGLMEVTARAYVAQLKREEAEKQPTRLDQDALSRQQQAPRALPPMIGEPTILPASR